MLKRILPITAMTLCIITQNAFCGGMLVTDPIQYNYLIAIDKKQQESLVFLQAIQDANLEIKDAIRGNKKMGVGMVTNYAFYHDFFSLPSHTQKSEKAVFISRNIETLYPPIKVSNLSQERVKRDQYQQNTLKSAFILSEMVINSTKQRGGDIISLSNDIDNNVTLKQAMDVNNRLLLEILLEIRNSNLISANMMKITASANFKGDIIYDPKEGEEIKDFLSGKSRLGQAIKRSSVKSGGFW